MRVEPRPRCTTRAVTALLDFAAIGIKDEIVRSDVGGRTFGDPDQLVKANTRTPVTHCTNGSDSRWYGAGIGKYDDNVVAIAVHFYERQRLLCVWPDMDFLRHGRYFT